MMDDYCAPQWADFTCSPQVFSDNYFEVEHEAHEPQLNVSPTAESDLSVECIGGTVPEQPVSESKFDDSLEPEPPVCTNVAYFLSHDDKKHATEETKEDGLSEAMTGMKLDDRSSKVHQTWNISISELTSEFKVSSAGQRTRAEAPERIRNPVSMFKSRSIIKSNNAGRKLSAKNVQIGDIQKKTSAQKTLATIDSCEEEGLTEKRLSFKIVTAPRRQSHLFRSKKRSVGRSQQKVLTCQYRRQSLKYRRCSNQFVSLAEAVSKFQNGTPQRFRTLSNKDAKPGPLMRMKRSPLKLTYPVSPALRCKQRSRQNTVLTKQEREQLELEEMKKHYVKATPIPANILKGPCALKKVAKKPVTVAEEFHLTQSKKAKGTQANPPQNDKEGRSVASITRSSSASSVIRKESAEHVAETTKPVPFSFEARNKKFQLKREEKLKTLHDQEINKTKAEFHARPVPKFSKPSKPANPVNEQNNKKRVVVQCPFSFEARDKTLAKKKEELLKQIQEKSKRAHVFHANPVPNFKPIAVHGPSKEKSVNRSKDIPLRQTKSCYDQENRQPNVMHNSTICAGTKKKETKQGVPNKETDKKQCKSSSMEETCSKSEKLNVSKKKLVKLELNTNKRAKERHEFDDKIKRKEEELEAKRQEEEKSKLLKEKMETAELRKMREMKARPMPVYKPLVLLRSTKPVTSPRSPAWASRVKPKGVS